MPESAAPESATPGHEPLADEVPDLAAAEPVDAPAPGQKPSPPYRTAFVLGGGGQLGACEVGMLRALVEAGIRPDLVLGASVGAINGAVIAADPTIASVDRLEKLWVGLGASGVFDDSLLTRLGTAVRTRTHLHANTGLRRRLEADLPVQLIEELAIPFQCVAASIERAAEHWFAEGPIADAVLASCAVPGLLPPVAVDGEHYLDGGLVNSVPVGRAIALGAQTVYVLHVGRIEQPLRVPERPWEVAAVAFEIARRHRFTRDIADLPPGVDLHILPTGAAPAGSGNWTQYMRYRDFTRIHERIGAAHRATGAYLAGR
ncbi:MAG TPA: patatin-like phospholipase family protein [Actinocrinis sp.]|nr:patatin-like phospholipase family protein [Actinocrinis sp.]